jgi:glycerol-3-phosphate dehydrogenase
MYDIAIIGGGINGCGIARDATGRRLNVLLAEMGDLASGTSSWSTKLIHGGLRYLEYYEFRLVREALTEREVLWSMAPHIIHPARFVLPHHEGLRPAWLLRTGLFLYDHLGGRRMLPGTKVLDLAKDVAGTPLKPQYTKGFEYSDCRVDDARLVVLNARDAADRGADIRTRTKVTSAVRAGHHWNLKLRDMLTGRETTESARLLVNAAGPWIDIVLQGAFHRNEAHNVRLVQGSHIVVPRLFEHDKCYMFQNSDGRIVFALPFERNYTLIGTTDEDYGGDPADARASAVEISYLCKTASGYFRESINANDVVWSFSGVRPLYDDRATKAQAATRDYVMHSEGGEDAPGLINIFGGKLTTYRRLAEEAVDKACGMLKSTEGSWTEGVPLPGGEFPPDSLDTEIALLRDAFPWLLRAHSERLFRTYGTRAHRILRRAADYDDLGRCFGADLYEREVEYLTENEWALTAKDVIWRRTKLGLRFSRGETSSLENWLKPRRRVTN